MGTPTEWCVMLPMLAHIIEEAPLEHMVAQICGLQWRLLHAAKVCRFLYTIDGFQAAR